MSLYTKRGVSAQKEEVHAATRHLSKGLYPRSFCKVYPDYLGGDEEFVNVMHADGAGTKSILAYLYWKETGDISVWKGIARDAVVMNLDDLLCTGIYDNILFNSTIDRNKHLIPGVVLEQIIDGTREFFEILAQYGIHIHYLGGETADVGDVVRTIAVNGTMSCRWPRKKIITNEKIVAGDVIVGLSSYGRAKYEDEYNSGIGSNGLTSARHDLLSAYYAENFPESFDTNLEKDVAYIGKYRLTDKLSISDEGELLIGKLLLSSTRTYAPVIKSILEEHFDKIHGLIHCSGGGQTKCMKFMPGNVRVIKDNLFPIPEIFTAIGKSSGSSAREMYEVFNMGCRLEIYCAEKDADSLIAVAAGFGIEGKVIGRTELSKESELVIRSKGAEERFSF